MLLDLLRNLLHLKKVLCYYIRLIVLLESAKIFLTIKLYNSGTGFLKYLSFDNLDAPQNEVVLNYDLDILLWRIFR